MFTFFKHFTSESVLPGHPDKIADQISDLVLDEYLRHDPNSRTAIEVLVTHKKIIISGETKGPIIQNHKIESVVREFLKNLNYRKEIFDWQSVQIINLLHEQSQEISAGVERSGGAGDQGVMFGYATEETQDFMPAPIHYANKILHNVQKSDRLGPDGKAQITINYDDHCRPISAENIVVSVQHQDDLKICDVKDIVYDCIQNSLPKDWMPKSQNIFINPAGSFTKGGPISDCGLTGRKIVIDTYGGFIQNGGGAFSGKDSTKVDRSAAYMSRYIAKNIVAAKLAKRCIVQICYAIGLNYPLSFQINTLGTSTVPQKKNYRLGNKKYQPSTNRN